MGVRKRNFGTLETGQQTYLYTIENESGMRADITNYGAALVSLWVPDQEGNLADVVLGFECVSGYESTDCCLGATVGRNCNRTRNAEITLHNIVYHLGKNENENNLHSGPNGYTYRPWAVTEIESNSIKFMLVSEDKDQGFPGTCFVTVTYTVTEDNILRVEYNAMSDQDTVMNLTNHSYFNLKGHQDGSILDHVLYLNAKSFTPIEPVTSIPTGEIRQVEGTPFDFTKEKMIGSEIEADCDQLKYAAGYDHNFVLDKEMKCFEKAASLEVPGVRKLEVYTDTPGIQIYTGNFLDVDGKEGKHYAKRSGVALETQFFPNAMNQENFPSPIIKAGEKYYSKTEYRFC